MASSELSLTPLEILHKQFMLEILKSVKDTPLVLKGGTALMLAYGLDRFSEDLDFDSPLKIHLDSKIKHSARRGISIEDLKIQKDTPTVTRYRVHYKTKSGPGTLKIEISHRDEIAEADVEIRDGFRVYSITNILSQKLRAAHDGNNPRTAIRDLYDIDFIARTYPDQFTFESATRLQAFAADPDELASRYNQAYQEDDLVQDRIPLEDLVLRLHETAITLLSNLSA